MKLGNLELNPVSDGLFKLDGGAMFGIVPKPLWIKRIKSDSANRIVLGLNALLIRTPQQNILVNTGIGDKYDEKMRKIYEIKHPPSLAASLDQHGLKPQDINMVILTHLHFDHCGGNTVIKDGKTVPTFPKAVYVIQKGEWESATNPTERTSGSYIKENFLPLKEHGLLKIIEGDEDVVPGIKVKLTGGHTKYHQVVLIESGGKKAIYWSDLIPTTAHIDLPYIMGYDLDPQETLKAKKELLEQAVNEKWLCFWEHDPEITHSYLTRESNRKIKIVPIT